MKMASLPRKLKVGLIALVCVWSLVTADNRKGLGGFLGCRFSKDVCNSDEECIDDRLFGNCQKQDEKKDFYKYFLEGKTLTNLEAEISRLIKNGYRWDNLYTQCVLGNILLAYRAGTQYDEYWCDRASLPKEKPLSVDSLNFLENYFQDYYDDLKNSNEDSSEDVVDVDSDSELLSPGEKRDEFVKIHKYFGPQEDKRIDRFGPPFLKKSPANDIPLDFDDASDPVDDYDYSYNDLVKDLKPGDLELLKTYLDELDKLQEEEESSEGARQEPPPQIDYRQAPPDPITDQDDQGYMWGGVEPVEPSDFQDAAAKRQDLDLWEQGMPSEQDSTEQDVASYQFMSPDDAKLLGDLLQGKVKVDDLSSEQVERLSKYVDDMLSTIAGSEDLQQLFNDEVIDPRKKDKAKKKVKKAETKMVKKEQLNEAVVNNPEGHSKVKVEIQTDSKNGPTVHKVTQDYEEEGTTTYKDPHDHSFDNPEKDPPTSYPKYDYVDGNFAFIKLANRLNETSASRLLVQLQKLLSLPPSSFSHIRIDHKNSELTFHVNPNSRHLNASGVAALAKKYGTLLQNRTGLYITETGIGRDSKKVVLANDTNNPKYFVLTFVLCGCIAGVVIAVIAIYVIKRHARSREKLDQLAQSGDSTEAPKDYEDLCRQRMQSKSSEKPEPLSAASRVGSVSTQETTVRSPSSRSSTSSWSEEPVSSNMDISTGHIVLSYMEDHLKNKDRLDQEWMALCAYEAEPNSTGVASEASNMRKNRYSDILPYDHSRVILGNTTNVSGSDYINANTITDHDPRNPAYIATQGPLPHTVADFWQMVWEQGSVVIVQLSKLTENGVAMCHRYWPEEGSDLYHIYEVHLVSEHIWCDDYLVRSFYLKNLQTNETRTVTQFHYLTWPDLGIPASTKALLDFRRKVNKSYRGRSCPIVVHCSDGVGRTGTYCLIDMVLNRLSKGAKEIDIAATLEHIRDQRMQMVKTREQFEFGLASVAEEVHAILKALPQ